LPVEITDLFSQLVKSPRWYAFIRSRVDLCISTLLNWTGPADVLSSSASSASSSSSSSGSASMAASTLLSATPCGFQALGAICFVAVPHPLELTDSFVSTVAERPDTLSLDAHDGHGKAKVFENGQTRVMIVTDLARQKAVVEFRAPRQITELSCRFCGVGITADERSVILNSPILSFN
jgi:hypothetical protein